MRITGDTSRLNKSRKPPLWEFESGVDDQIVKENSALAAARADGAFVRLSSPTDAPAVRAVPIVYIGGFVDIDVKLGAVVLGPRWGATAWPQTTQR
jgi:hypothetical protein